MTLIVPPVYQNRIKSISKMYEFDESYQIRIEIVSKVYQFDEVYQNRIDTPSKTHCKKRDIV